MHRIAILVTLAVFGCDSKPEAKPDAKPAKAEAKNDAKTDAKVDAKVDANVDAKVDTKTDAKVTPEPSDEPDSPADAIEDEAPSAPASALTAFAGPLKFDPVESGDGKLPADNMGMIEEDGGTMMDHPTDLGWTKDGTAFGYCLPGGGRDCTTCTITGLDGKTESWERGSECDGKDDAKTIASEWAKRGIGKQPIPGTWEFGRDLTIVWKVLPGKEGETKATTKFTSLQVGAQVGTDEPVYFMHMESKEAGEDYWEYDIFPEVIIPSPNGEHLAIMWHTFAGEYSDTIGLKLEPSADFAFAAYHATALKALKAKPARAAELLASAGEIKPKSWKVQYNLACAFALAGELEKAKQPLTDAIAGGGDEVKGKAKTDADLESLRSEAWFTGLVE